MKNILKLILSGLILFGSVPTLTAMDTSNGMEEIKKKKKKGKKLKGKASKGKKGGWGKWKSKWKKKKSE
jgi:hypothetical protein|tara:strand:+ start:44 stop:250 length:207 start_codon:yes stop_codon:yes gene_type:complete